MHPMFVKLYLENDADDVLAEEENRRRAANRARRARSRQATRVVARDRGRGRPVRLLSERFRSRLAGRRRTGSGRR